MTIDEIESGDSCPYCGESAIYFDAMYATQCPGCQTNLCDANYVDPYLRGSVCLVDIDGYLDAVLHESRR